jgi:hypothetical protein
MDIEVKLEPTELAPSAARRFVARELEGLGFAELVDDARLMVSELVTNSSRYASGKPLWVDLRRAGRYLVLEVWDCSPEPPVGESSGLSGRGWAWLAGGCGTGAQVRLRLVLLRQSYMGGVGVMEMGYGALSKEEASVLAVVQKDESPAWCHRHLARGEQVIAAHTEVWIELDVIVTTPDLCQGCLEDLDSWLRLFGVREALEEAPEDCAEDGAAE